VTIVALKQELQLKVGRSRPQSERGGSLNRNRQDDVGFQQSCPTRFAKFQL